MGKENVDEIWKKLNTQPSAKNKAKLDEVWSKINTGAAGKDKKNVKKEKIVEDKCMLAGFENAAVKRGADAGSSAGDGSITAAEVLAGFQGGDVFALGAHMQRDLNALQSDNAKTRLRSLHRIRAVLDAPQEQLSRDVKLDSVCQLFVKPVLKRFEDPVEKAREIAASILLKMGQDLKEVTLELLPYAVPVFRQRLALVPDTLSSLVEVSEEVRFTLLSALRTLVLAAEEGVAPYASDIADIIKDMAKDQAPEPLQEACQCATDMARILGRRMQPVSHELVKGLTPIFEHKRAKVRVACLQAIGMVMHCGAHETILDLSSFRHPNLVKIQAFYGDDQKINWFGKFCTDSSAAVRETWVRVAGDWCLNLWERLDHETRLIPYVLHGFGDPEPKVQAASLHYIHLIGKQYEKEKKEDLKDTLYYLPEDSALPAGEFKGGPLGYLPPPFKERPGLGEREVVSSNMKALLYPLLAELKVWTDHNRAASARLLRTCLIMSEVRITQHTHRIVPTFVQVIHDKTIQVDVENCCRVLGYFVEADHWMEMLLPRISLEEPVETIASALQVLRHLTLGAMFGAVGPFMRELLDRLLQPEMMRTQHSALKSEVVELMAVLLEMCEEDCLDCLQDVVVLLMHYSVPVPHDIPQVQAKAREVMSALGSLQGLPGTELLASLRLPLLRSLKTKQSLQAWGRFENHLLMQITQDLPAHPSAKDVRELVELLLELLPMLTTRSAVRAIPALFCLSQTSVPLKQDDARLLMDALLARLQDRDVDEKDSVAIRGKVRSSPAGGVASQGDGQNSSESAQYQYSEYPAMTAVLILLAGDLIPHQVMSAGWSGGVWMSAVTACMDNLTEASLRLESLMLVKTMLLNYELSDILPQDEGVDSELCSLVLRRVDDSDPTIRTEALRVTELLTISLSQRPHIHRIIDSACKLAHLTEDDDESFREALEAVQMAIIPADEAAIVGKLQNIDLEDQAVCDIDLLCDVD